MSDQPVIQTTVNGTVISSSFIMTTIEKNENGIDMITLTANNEDGQSYLATLKINDSIVVKGLSQAPNPTSGEGWYNDTITWSSVPPCFVGTIQELSPKLSSDGEICAVVGYGNGYQLKEMRVAQEYGYVVPVQEWAFVYGYDNTITTSWIKQGSDPYIGGYSYYHFIKYDLSNYNTNAAIGAFAFGINTEFNGGSLSQLELHIVAGIYPLPYNTTYTSGDISSGVTITPYWRTASNPSWTAFHGTEVISPNPNSTSFFASNILTPPLVSWAFNIPYWGPYTGSYAFLTGYNPVTDYAEGPPTGADLAIDMTVDFPYWDSTLEIKLVVTGYSGNKAGGVSIAEMYLLYNFNKYQGKTVRELLAGEQGTVGLIPTFVNNVMSIKKYVGVSTEFPTGFQSITLPSGWSPIGTDYIVMDSYTEAMLNGYNQSGVTNYTDFLIPYLKLPYEDCMTALQDIIKYESALRFLDGLSGYHWIIDTNGNLLIAPCSNAGVASSTNHHVWGKISTDWIDSNMSGTTIPWVSQPYPTTPIVVKQNMIIQDFKEEPPIANFVLVAGKFQYPLHDDICRGLGGPNDTVNGDYWQLYGYTTVDLVDNELEAASYFFSNIKVYQLANDEGWQEPCLELHGPSPYSVFTLTTGINGLTLIYTYPLQDLNGNPIDLTQLMGYNTVPSVSFWFKYGNYTESYQLRFYIENPDISGEPQLNTYFVCTFTPTNTQDQWGFVEIPLPNVVNYKDFNNWQIRSEACTTVFNFMEGEPANISWTDFNKIKYFAISYEVQANVSISAECYCRIAGLSINGVVIRGAYDSGSIASYGCRVLTVKDTYAQTDTLTYDDNAPLNLEAIYDLQRYRRVYLTGTITIPFDPIWLAGQQAWILAEDVIPLVGSSQLVQSHSGNPTTSTVGGLGTYYVNTSNYEVFICTHISGSVYTWTDQDYPRYRINQWFRVTKVMHSYDRSRAITTLTLTNDLSSSLPVDTNNVYSVTMRLMNVDFQSRVMGSLKSDSDFDLGLPCIATDYTSFTQ